MEEVGEAVIVDETPVKESQATNADIISDSESSPPEPLAPPVLAIVPETDDNAKAVAKVPIAVVVEKESAKVGEQPKPRPPDCTAFLLV